MSENLQLELNRSVLGFAKGAIIITLIINGGGALAILTFIGNIWSPNIDKNLWIGSACAISYFGFGLLATAVGVMAGYFRELLYSYSYLTSNPKPDESGVQKPSKTTWCFHIIAVLMILVSMILFGFGVCKFFDALILFAPAG